MIVERYRQQTIQAQASPVEGAFLETRYRLSETEPVSITVGRGEAWTPLACKEAYGKAVKTALELKCESCLFDLTAAGELGLEGLCAAMEGVYGGGYRQSFALSGRWEPELTCYAGGSGWREEDLAVACRLARSIVETRNLVNRPANLLTPELFAQTLAELAVDLPIQARIYHRQELAERGLGHSDSRAVRAHSRNLTDDQFQVIRDMKGLVGINFCTMFLADVEEGDTRVTPEQLMAHILHLLDLGGEDCIALGSDFDGATLPAFLEGTQSLGDLRDVMLAAGLGEALTDKICFQNAMDFWKRYEKTPG